MDTSYANNSLNNIDSRIDYQDEDFSINISDETKQRIKKHEGKESMPYQLSYEQDDGTKVKEDFWTVGRGHKLDINNNPFEINRKYSNKEIEELFEQDVNKAASSVDELVNKSKVDPKAYNLMVEMAFQMGGEGLKKFEKTIASVNAGEYEEASKHMLWNYNDDGSVKGKTKWHNQTPERAEELSNLMADILDKE